MSRKNLLFFQMVKLPSQECKPATAKIIFFIPLKSFLVNIFSDGNQPTQRPAETFPSTPECGRQLRQYILQLQRLTSSRKCQPGTFPGHWPIPMGGNSKLYRHNGMQWVLESQASPLPLQLQSAWLAFGTFTQLSQASPTPSPSASCCRGL